jgi:YggT family protein
MRDIAGLIHLLIQIEVILIIIRIVISWLPNVDMGNPLVRALCAVVDPVLRVFRPILPSFSGIDVTPVLAIVVLQAVGGALDAYASSIAVNFGQLLVYIAERVLLAVVAIMAVIVFIRLILSFLRPDPWHPTVRLIRDMSRPLVEPFGRVLPRARAVDVPAIGALVGFIVLYEVIQAVLDRLIVRI